MFASSGFTVAGMSSSTNTHQQNPGNWASASTSSQLGASLGDSLTQSRSHYQPGYLLSTSQNTNVPQGGQRMDEVPIVQTKAKINNVLTRGSTSEFGMESMFQSSRQRQALMDEDAPPRSSIHDIPNETHVDMPPRTISGKTSTLEVSHLGRRHTRPPAQTSQPIYVIIFGYPPEKYTATVEYFKSLGNTTEPEPNTEVVNCFRIGYYDPADAMRAVRKNGEVVAGSWMIGAKWADATQAEVLLGQPLPRSSAIGPSDINTSGAPMAIDEPTQSSFPNTPTVGTPIRLAPSTSAFKKSGAPSKPVTPLPIKPADVTTSSANAQANRGVLGQVSDLIFGW